ncbi:MAG TPA: hypothetical protein VFX59_08320 [Polyangiales bacterium]|nr:hypothetical protein [Polyangiales bacterium]
MWLTYSFLVAWIGGGLVLLAMLALRTERRPYPVALAALGYGVTGFLGTGFGVTPRLTLVLGALGAAALGAALGYGLSRLFRPAPGLPLDVRT